MSIAAFFPPFGDDSFDDWTASQMAIRRPDIDFGAQAVRFRTGAFLFGAIAMSGLVGVVTDDGWRAFCGLGLTISASYMLLDLARLSLLCSLCAECRVRSSFDARAV